MFLNPTLRFLILITFPEQLSVSITSSEAWAKWLSYGSLEQLVPVVVEPGAVAGDDDVVGLLGHVVLARVHQPVDFSFALLLVVLKEEESHRSERGSQAECKTL